MSNTRYPLGLKAVADADVDLLVDTISVQGYSGAAVYNAAHDFLDDIAGSKAGSPVTLAGKATTGGLLTFTSPLAFTFPAVTVVALVLYKNTGNDATSQLLAWIDQRLDGTALSIVGNGTVVNLNWTGPIYSIGG